MNKVLVIPDSFKGTLSSTTLCRLMEERVHAHFPRCRVVAVPVADGGEGSVECFLQALGGERVERTVQGPLGDPTPAFYGLLGDGRTAVIEMAAAAGLPLIEERKDPLRASTFGVGQLMLDAARRGAERLIVGLGGSATNDGGCGAAAAAGVSFYDAYGRAFVPTGGTLAKICRIDRSTLDPSLREIPIIVMCDIDNPMCGKNGAAHVFGPQKGADPAAVETLDQGLCHLAEIMRRDLGADVAEEPGAGAAGAMGAGMLAFFQVKMQMGIETVLDTVGFDEMLRGADLVLTGEGKLDRQSLRGKVVVGVARRAKRAGVPVVALVGGADDGGEEAYGEGVTAVFTINRLPQPLSESRGKSAENAAFAMDNLMRLIKAVK